MIPKSTSLLPSLFVGCLLITTAGVPAADWPQYRGPRHDGTSVEKDIATRWPKGQPKVLWRKPAGNAFGSFAVAGGRAFLFMERDGNEVLVALSPDTGDELWATPVDKTIFERQGGNGPRTTPVVDGERVYVIGTYFKLACLNAADALDLSWTLRPRGRPRKESRPALSQTSPSSAHVR